ncbi:MAG: low molecular weight protein arginine phosphatase [Firmicutes bacterium]|nr:low molecular weight protein arginine phosphatase [Bacillota bacterium]
MEKKKKLIFVCSGNTCRSPLAKVLARDIFAKAGLDDWAVDSAGTAALHGMSASGHALTAAHTLGLDLSLHQAKPITEMLAQEADLILVMTRAHKDFLLHTWPALAGKIYTIKEFVGEAGDVADPFGKTAAHYLETAQELQALLQQVAKKLAAGADETTEAEGEA